MSEFDDQEMFEDDFNDEISNMQRQAKMQENMLQIKDKLARANYNGILKCGVDVERLDQPEIIKNIIAETLVYFQEIEEYEKCAKLKRVLESF